MQAEFAPRATQVWLKAFKPGRVTAFERLLTTFASLPLAHTSRLRVYLLRASCYASNPSFVPPRYARLQLAFGEESCAFYIHGGIGQRDQLLSTNILVMLLMCIRTATLGVSEILYNNSDNTALLRTLCNNQEIIASLNQELLITCLQA